MTTLMADPIPFVHHPVLLDRVLDLFSAVPGGTIIDTTLGGAGHATALLDSRPDLRILGIDRDPQALVAARARLAPYGERATAHHARFDRLAAVAGAAGATSQPIVGVLFDLGVSSPQFDRPERGFSYRNDAPLDMRMDPTEGRSAADLVNTSSEAEIASILRRYGDERFAGRIARALVAARPVTRTGQLSDLVVAAIPAATRRKGGHPAKRTFQALRIAVNEELDVLGPALDDAIAITEPGGRIVAITYHSGEDRIVKQRFVRADDGGCTCPVGLPCVCGATPSARLLKRGGWVAEPAEAEANPRATSARLRAVQKLPTDGQDQS